MDEKPRSILDTVLLILLTVCCLREMGGISGGPSGTKDLYEGCKVLDLTNSKMNIELICFGVLKLGFVNNYIADVKKMFFKSPNKQK